MDIILIFFIVLGTIAIGSAVVTISSRNPIIAAMALVVHFFMLSGLYLTLQAQFVAIMQILVYAGAIMVLVVFVIMLLNLGDDEKLKERWNFRKIAAVALAFALVVEMFAVYFSQTTTPGQISLKASAIGSVESIGDEMFTKYLVQFEAIAILLLSAIVGALLLAKKKVS